MDTPQALTSVPISPQPAVSSLPVEALSKTGPAEFSSRRWLLWLVGGLVMLIIGIAVGIFSAKFLNQSPSPSPLTSTPSPTLSPIPTPIVSPKPAAEADDPTAGWKTYINTEDGYSIKYPNEILLRLVCQGEGLALVFKDLNYSGADPLEMPTCARDSRYTIEISVMTTPKTSPKSINGYIVSQQSITIGEIIGTKYTVVRQSTAIGPGEEWYVEIISQRNGKSYDFYLGDRKLQTAFDQILSTFHFLK